MWCVRGCYAHSNVRFTSTVMEIIHTSPLILVLFNLNFPPFTREKKTSHWKKKPQSQLDANSSFVFLSHLFCWQPFYVDLDFKRPNKHMPNEWKSKMAIIRWPKRVWNSPHIRGLALRTLCIGSYFLITALFSLCVFFVFFEGQRPTKTNYSVNVRVNERMLFRLSSHYMDRWVLKTSQYIPATAITPTSNNAEKKKE